ncbi:hypothetical protein [Prosthecobacter sp.]|uniref:hypothetical protein n=1 Tax=Prosthecobacter sp. TaxID=1965333 RepID=UPI003784DF34
MSITVCLLSEITAIIENQTAGTDAVIKAPHWINHFITQGKLVFPILRMYRDPDVGGKGNHSTFQTSW